jgi:hypothetical protein
MCISAGLETESTQLKPPFDTGLKMPRYRSHTTAVVSIRNILPQVIFRF